MAIIVSQELRLMPGPVGKSAVYWLNGPAFASSVICFSGASTRASGADVVGGGACVAAVKEGRTSQEEQAAAVSLSLLD